MRRKRTSLNSSGWLPPTLTSPSPPYVTQVGTPTEPAMRRSARTAAAMKNLRANLDARMRDAGPAMSAGLVKRGPDNVRDVDPETRRLINEALAARGMRGTGG